MSLAPLPVVDENGASLKRTADVAQLRSVLERTVAGEVRFDRLSRALYSTDASVYQIVPLGVVLPRTEADVVAVIKACERFDAPITARGGGTSQAGQAIGPGLVLDFSKYYNRVLEINAGERWVRVQPGCVLDDLNLAVQPFGLQFAPDLSTSNRATIGGMIANNSSGAHSIIHGKTVDHVLEIKTILADGSTIESRALTDSQLEAKCRQQDLEGAAHRLIRRLAAEHADEIDRRYPKIVRRVGGYNLDLFVGTKPFNLAHLLVGSEGTLGITIEAKLRLVELPKAKALLVVHFGDLLEALAATPTILAHNPSAVEVVDKYVLDSTRMNPDAARLRDFLQGDPAAILLIEFFGDRKEELAQRVETLASELTHRGWGYHYHPATKPSAQARIWKLRKMALGLSMAQKGDAKAISFVEDTAVSPEHLRDYIAEFLAIVARHGTTAGVYAHASVGCLHVRPVINLKTEQGVRQFEAIAGEVADLVLKYGGALSGEHGDGLVRSPFQERMYGPVLYNAFRELKRTFDPHNLFNPGKIVDAPPLVNNLRYGPDYVTPHLGTTFDFSADGGMARAAELCSGVGACRKRRDGAMCPSYRATLEEQHSTRGRANALRLAMTGQLGTKGLADPALLEAFDLCLECKACKSECPTNVDMARLKAEFLHQYYQRRGLPLRNRLLGNVALLGQWGCRLAPVSNWLTRSRLTCWLNERLLGLDRRRLPPAFARKKFTALARRAAKEITAENMTPAACLFPDTSVNYFEPEIGLDAIEVMKRVGYRALISDTRCCGRPMISNGLLSQAVENARYNVERLFPHADIGKQIIACEPSCILTIKDDYPVLLRGELRRQAEVVAGACRTFEEFVESALAAGSPPAWNLLAGPKAIMVQGHCHQRALTGMESTLRLLRRVPGAEVIDLDAGCCGMAGAFGHEKEHYEISRLVGEQQLFPALREAPDGTAVIAPGFSCRVQIKHFTGRTALHPAQLLRALLDRDEE
jgi:FAD/FMN-containing dehydrogenase/Fe-S oxidoreductase